MDSEHPYAPPASDLSGPASGGTGEGGISPGIVAVLRKTRPWVLFMGVMTLIGAGLMLVLGLFVMAAGGLAGGELGPLGGIGLGLFYIVFAAVYIVPGLYLVRFAGAIKRIDLHGARAVEEALGYQLSFWRIAGIIAIVFLVLYVLVFVGAVFFGILGAMAS